MVSLGVRQLVTAPATPVQSRNIVVDTEGDNILVEIAESGRVVLPLRDARPLIEEVSLDYGSEASKALVKDEFLALGKTSGPKTSYLRSSEALSSWPMSGTGALFLALLLMALVVGMVALTRVVLHRQHHSGNKEDIVC